MEKSRGDAMTREQLEALKVDISDHANWAPTTRILVLQMFEEYASQRARIEQQAQEVARLKEALARIARNCEEDESDALLKMHIHTLAKQVLKEEHP